MRTPYRHTCGHPVNYGKFQRGWNTGSMSSTKSPGKALVEALAQDLPQGMEFDETETATLALIEAAADRLVSVRRRFDEVVADPATTGSMVASWQTAIHQLEGDIFRWTKSLNLGATQAKSVRHQHAINTRWARAREG